MSFPFRSQREEVFEILVDATSEDIGDITTFMDRFFDGTLKPAGRDVCLHCSRPVNPTNFRAIRLFDPGFKEYFTFYFHNNCAQTMVKLAIEEERRRYS